MAKEKVSYLRTLKFDKKLLNSFPAKYLANVRLPILLILLTVIVGAFAFVNIPRRLNPEINITIVNVNTIIPGAGPDDVESLVTIPLERAVSGIEDIDMMTSISRESNSNVTIQFLSTVNKDDALNDVQTAVDSVSDLPEDALTPNVRAFNFDDQAFWTFALTSKSDLPSLMRFGEELSDRIENIAEVDRVETSGLDDQTIEVIIDSTRLREYNINPLMISGLLQGAAKSLPAGTVYSGSSTFSLTVNREIITVDDIRNIRIATGNTNIRLGDIANVSTRSKAGQQSTFLAAKNKAPERTIQFFVYKTDAADIDEAFAKTEPVVNEEVKKYNGQFSIVTIQNTADLIEEQFSDLNREFTTTSVLVFLLLFLFLGLRQGIIANVTVPLTFLSTFAVINALGLSLNFLTVFSFLLSLGILIDDTIVVVAAMTRYYKTGRFTPYQAGILVWRDFWTPLWSSAITTIWGFVPLLLSVGIIGEFIKSIPIVVTTTMLSSTIISIFITIPLMIIFLKPEFPSRVQKLLVILGIIIFIGLLVLLSPKNSLLPVIIVTGVLLLLIFFRLRKNLALGYRKFITTNKRGKFWSQKLSQISDHGLINIEKLSENYRNVIEKILASATSRRNTLIAISVFTILAYLLLPLGLIKNEFFPKEDAELIYAVADLPPGTNNDRVTQEALLLARELRKTEHLDYLVAEVGQVFQSTGMRESDPDAILFTMHLTKPEERKPSSSDIAEDVRERFAGYTQGNFTVVELTGGPPAGADIQIQLLGEDLAVLDQYAQKIIIYLKKQPGVINIDKSIKPGTSKVVFVPDKTKIADAGLSLDQIGLWLRTYASGFTLDSILFGTDEEEEDVTFRINSYDNKSLESLSSVEIPLQGPTGGSMPLSALGSFKLETNPTVITREDEKRTISVFAGVEQGVNIPEANKKLLDYANSLELPQGYEWKTGGVNEENQKSVESILQSMILAFLLIAITMVVEFSSFRQAFIAMLMIPISVAGVFYIFALLGVPLSFAALIGVLALFGIVMRHAIVVLEKINENRAHGMNLHDSIADAAASRLEPVLLTSLATIVALIPITIADPFWRGLGGAIIAGLLFTGALKLFFIPVLYFNFYKD